jgi:hypothetical protein
VACSRVRSMEIFIASPFSSRHTACRRVCPKPKPRPSAHNYARSTKPFHNKSVRAMLE